MRQLIPTGRRSLTLAERLRRALAPEFTVSGGAPAPPVTAMLLDLSGSMAEDCEPGRAGYAIGPT